MNVSRSGLSRREAVKRLGAGAALLGLGGLPLSMLGAEKTGATEGGTTPLPDQTFSLPPLGYAYDALEPHIDARTMEIHHTKHHQAYVNTANNALANYPDLRRQSLPALLKNINRVPEAIRTAVRNNAGGHANHALFWRVIAPGGERKPGGALEEALTKAFGSVDAFQAQFSDAAAKRFGSGWAWLSVKDGALQVHSTPNQDSPLMEGATPVLGLDVWEHAYYLKYQNRRGDYVQAFWNIVNWTQVGENYRAAMTA